jgi:hypothetical protein
MTDLDTIARRAELYAQARNLLTEHVGALNDGIAALRRDHIPAIKRALARAAEKESELRALVEQHWC